MAASVTERAEPQDSAAPVRVRRRVAAERRRPARVPRSAQQRRPFELDGSTVVALGLLAMFALIALFAAYLLVGSRMAASRHQDVLYGQLKEDLALATVPVGGVIATGTPVGIVEVPKLGLEQVFVIGSASEQTLDAPGLRHDSVLPGQAGISVIVGRRATGGAPFAHLDQMRVGDAIKVTTGQGVFTYVVDLVRTSDAPDAQIEQADSRLTLVTSDPAYAPSRTLQVSAVIDGVALPASTGAATVADDAPGAGSHDRGVALLLWAQLLLVLVVVVTWASVRLPTRAIWIGAVPVLLAVLWNVYANLAALLPNTL